MQNQIPTGLIKFTDAAARKVMELIMEEHNPELKLRVYISGGGCSGFQYGFTFDEDSSEDDIAITNEGVTLLVDPLSFQYLMGAEVDYSENLQGAQFVIRNPNAATTCGCGSSFSLSLMNASGTDHLARSKRNQFTAVRLNRETELRDDAQWVAKTLANPSTRLVPLWRSRSLLARNAQGTTAIYLSNTELNESDRIQPPTLLGNDGEREYFAVSVTDAQKDAILAMLPNVQFADLRGASIDMAAKHAGILAYAKALHYWQHRHAFCGVCGNPNLLRSAGHRMVCSNEECTRESFPRIDPAIIVLVTHKDHCLLGRNAKWRPKHFSTLAGFVEPGESLEDAVVREVYEEVRLQLEDIRYVSSQPWPFPASAMCGFYAEAADRNSGTSEEVEETRWFTVESLTQAIIADEVRLSPPVSIAFRLLADWFRKNGGGSLEELVRRQRSMNVRAPTC